ncbi:MAG: hypothetical protein IJ568_01725 [Bacilli bacterium]|nr:hypothetical protein [Bacilli bacterium]
MIKKAISFSIILMVLALGYQFLVTLIKDSHNISYVIEKDEKYNIEEHYIKSSNDDYYIIKVENNEDSFIFDIDNTFNKQKEIVKDVLTYKDDDISCIALVYRKGASLPLCKTKDRTITYYSIKNNSKLEEYLKTIPGLVKNKYKEKSEQRKESKIVINKDYIEENEVIMTYDYKRVLFNKNDSTDSFTFSISDIYENSLGAKVNDYYIIPKYTTSATISSFYKYNVATRSMGNIDLDFSLSKQSYINGVYNNSLYIFDKSNLTQYQIDPEKEIVRIVGNENQEGINIVDGKEEAISVYDLNKENIIFTFDESSYESFDCDSIYSNKNRYAICKKGNDFYKIYKEAKELYIYLFSEDNVKDIKLANKNIYYMKNDTIYRFNEYGNLPIIKSNEFNYNYKNVFDIYFK